MLYRMPRIYIYMYVYRFFLCIDSRRDTICIDNATFWDSLKNHVLTMQTSREKAKEIRLSAYIKGFWSNFSVMS